MWDWSFRNGLISIGWHEVGNLDGASKDEIGQRYLEEYDNQAYPSLQRFWHDIDVGDRVIARAGLKRIVGIGTIESEPFFDLEVGRVVTGGMDTNIHPNLLRVKWMNHEHEFPNSVFSGHLKTVSELREGQKHWSALKEVLSQVWDVP